MKKFQNLITIATVLALILILTLTSCSKDSKDETKPVEPEFELKGIVTTLAGSSAGDVDGVGELAKFFGPLGMCTDENGNIYVVDTNNNKIKKISPSGVVTTFAGSTQGDLDSVNPLNAKFYSPRDICRDSQGNFYITDSGNNKIKKISKIGGVSTINTSSINFNKIFSICLDNSDNLYVSDIYNTTYRFTKIIKITPNGIISYFVGSTNSQDLRLAADMCFDKDNNL